MFCVRPRDGRLPFALHASPKLLPGSHHDHRTDVRNGGLQVRAPRSIGSNALSLCAVSKQFLYRESWALAYVVGPGLEREAENGNAQSLELRREPAQKFD